MIDFKHKSVLRRGAEDGVSFGVYLSALFMFAAFSSKLPILGHISSIMALAVPVYTFITLRKGFVRNGYFYTFSEVWTHGIILFLCGTLILATTIVVYISWFNPTFIYDQCQLAITAYQQIGGPIGTEMASSLEMIIKNGMLPTPLSIAGNIISFGVFSGSILSLLLTPVIRYFRPKDIDRNKSTKI